VEIKLFVDDMRAGPKGWVISREITSAIRLLATQNVVAVSLDHDIAIQKWIPNKRIKIDLMLENYTAVAWFIATMPKDIRPKTVLIHTGSISGREYMDWILKDKVDKLVHVYNYDNDKEEVKEAYEQV